MVREGKSRRSLSSNFLSEGTAPALRDIGLVDGSPGETLLLTYSLFIGNPEMGKTSGSVLTETTASDL